MRTLFSMLGCSFCSEEKMAILHINNSLPLGEKINIVDGHSGDPRLSYLASLFKSKDTYNWRLPQLKIDNKIMKKYFNDHYVGKGEQKLLLSIFDFKYHVTLLKNLLN